MMNSKEQIKSVTSTKLSKISEENGQPPLGDENSDGFVNIRTNN